MSALKLYYFETTSSRKPCAVAKHLGAPVQYVRVDLTKGAHKQPEYLAINPNGKVPALIDGDLKLWESNAIMAHLARSAGSDLWPQDERQIEVLRWLCWDAAHFSRHGGALFFQNVVVPRNYNRAPDAAAVEEARGFWKQFAQVLDDHLKGRSAVVDNGLTIADFALAAVLPYAKEAGLPLDGFAEIARWHARLMELPAWRDPFPAVAQAAA